jgi:hypothetical protein
VRAGVVLRDERPLWFRTAVGMCRFMASPVDSMLSALLLVLLLVIL